ncbi:hypothetical protein ACTTAF_05110 [Rhodobacter capsulatus]|uniref:hypothetical protein n=1 Tax=Rhodobacter capsulatus TaxID=1061 RepID=UPI0003D327DE|nr:hypothetical protein [Rhodobacter capsulatus]ETD81814.1 hypothetical protein U703_14670 [Rhodobacter capsulatus YW1]
MSKKSRATGPARSPGVAASKRKAQPEARAAAAPAEAAEVLCALCWDRTDPAAGQILLCRDAAGGFAGSVVLPGMQAMQRRAEDLATLICWLEALQAPARPPGVEAGCSAECLAEDRLEDLLLLAANRALQDKFDQLRGEALALWSDIEGKDCR